MMKHSARQRSMPFMHLLQPRTANVAQEAGFLRRALAFVFDILLLDLLLGGQFMPVFDGMMARMEQGGWTNVSYTNTELFAALMLFALIYLYFVLFEYTLGQTIGMMLFDIRVEGGTGLWRMLARNSFIIPLFPFIALWIIEPIAIAVWRRSVLEHLTGTRTLHRRTIML